MRKKILVVAAVILVMIQFIRPARNESKGKSANDISNVYAVPPGVSGILKKACTDCHSNNTIYPWYTNIQPVGWWMQHHVNEGKDELNFSEFVSYSPKRQHHSMEGTAELVEKGGMPLDSYTWIHKDAILTDAEKKILIDWAKNIMNNVASRHDVSDDDH